MTRFLVFIQMGASGVFTARTTR